MAMLEATSFCHIPMLMSPLQGGVGVDAGVQRLVALAVSFGLLGADEAALLEAGDDAFGGQLAETVGLEAAGEMDCAGAAP